MDGSPLLKIGQISQEDTPESQTNREWNGRRNEIGGMLLRNGSAYSKNSRKFQRDGNHALRTHQSPVSPELGGNAALNPEGNAALVRTKVDVQVC